MSSKVICFPEKRISQQGFLHLFRTALIPFEFIQVSQRIYYFREEKNYKKLHKRTSGEVSEELKLT